MAEGSEEETGPGARRKARLSQSDVPSLSIVEAMRVPEALRDQYAKQPARPLMVAAALDMTPTGGHFRALTGAAVAYGLTDGAAQSESIGLTELGRRAVAPTSEGDDAAAMREAVLQPRVVRQFLQKYDGSKVPSRPIALNVLEEMDVPGEVTARALDMILENAKTAGFIQQISGQDYVNLDGTKGGSPGLAFRDLTGADPEDVWDEPEREAPLVDVPTPPPAVTLSNNIATNKRVFVSHGKNSDIVNQIKELLTFGGFEPIVSVEKESVSKPVPDKVMDDMRSCGAGIVHVGSEMKLLTVGGEEVRVLNENVLIEIGAAMALFKRNFILLVEKGVTLPSNLQGLYEVRYEGDKLDYESTMKLLKAFNDFKTSSSEE